MPGTARWSFGTQIRIVCNCCFNATNDKTLSISLNWVTRMTSDKQTIAVYDLRVDEYASAFAKAETDPALTRFIHKLPQRARVLDFGCGPGTHAAVLAAHGCQVTATDASAGMVKLARTRSGADVQQAEFSDLCENETYDAVWANFSLLHATRSAFPIHLEQIATALKSKGIFHIGMKTGEGERRDHLGRNYTFYTVESLRALLQAAGFNVLEEVSGESTGLAGTVDSWIEVLAQSKR